MKQVIFLCDRCNKQSAPDNLVHGTTVVAPGPSTGRLDLCADCRFEVCKFAGYDEVEAAAIVGRHVARSGGDEDGGDGNGGETSSRYPSRG